MLIKDQQIENYCLSKSTIPSRLCEELFEATVKSVPMSQMLIGPMVGSLLQFLVRSTRAERVLEIGTFTGYSALCMAEALPDGGELITLDINEETTKMGKDYWKKSPHGKKIKLILGSATESLKSIRGPFDLILIDADKAQYLTYLKTGLELISDRGVIALDNCLWSGKVLEANEKDPDTVALRGVADFIHSRSDLHSILLPIRDGVFLVQKKN